MKLRCIVTFMRAFSFSNQPTTTTLLETFREEIHSGKIGLPPKIQNAAEKGLGETFLKRLRRKEKIKILTVDLTQPQRCKYISFLSRLPTVCSTLKAHLSGSIPGFIPSHQWEESILHIHRRIPRPLYEVKNFINDLVVNMTWVRELTSSYSSPIVCVRKKDQSLRLCIDYRLLNKKFVPDKHWVSLDISSSEISRVP